MSAVTMGSVGKSVADHYSCPRKVLYALPFRHCDERIRRALLGRSSYTSMPGHHWSGSSGLQEAP